MSRTWGALLSIGEGREAWCSKKMQLLARDNPTAMREGELKGFLLSDEAVTSARFMMSGEDMYFWGRTYPERTNPGMLEIQQHFKTSLARVKVNPSHPDRQELQGKATRLAEFIGDIKNTHVAKFVSMIAHFQALFWLLENQNLGGSLARFDVRVDCENFPEPDLVSWGLKTWVAAGLQSVGMRENLTGEAWVEAHNTGAVTVDVDCNSALSPGLQFVDILLQGTLRGLPAFR